MGKCTYCRTDVFLKDEETRCDRCKKIVRYYCNTCKNPFDVQDKKTKKKEFECKWCGYFLCPNCNACSSTCSKFEHINKIKKILKEVIRIDKWGEMNIKSQEIVDYFEEVKMGREKTFCELGVPKTYAKERIKSILARMDGFQVRSLKDQKAFEARHKESLNKDIGYEFTIGNSRDDGSYGQEDRDVFNLCVCLGTLKYERKSWTNKKGIEIGYDSWIRVEENQCPNLDVKELIIKYCPQCSKPFSRNVEYCDECKYKVNYKGHQIGELKRVALKEKLSNNPTCKIISQFKKRGQNGGSESEEEN